jgi:dephospho-CoA kinase
MGVIERRAISARAAVGISGKTAAGKSSLVQAIASAPHARIISFGGHVRRQAVARGLPVDRPSLQELGQNLIESEGAERFLDGALEEEGDVNTELCIFDGVRHVAIWSAISGRFASAVLVHVTCNDPERKRRLIARDGLSPDEAERVLAHEMEGAVDDLASSAVLEVHADRLSPRQLLEFGQALGRALVGTA